MFPVEKKCPKCKKTFMGTIFLYLCPKCKKEESKRGKEEYLKRAREGKSLSQRMDQLEEEMYDLQGHRHFDPNAKLG